MTTLFHISKKFIKLIAMFILVFALVLFIGCGENTDGEENPGGEENLGGEENPRGEENPGDEDNPVITPEKKPIEEILEWAVNEVGTEGIDEVKLPKVHPTLGGTISWSSENTKLFDVEYEILDMVEFDEKTNITCTVEYNGETLSKTYEYTVIGYSLNDIAVKFISVIKGDKVIKDVTFVTEYADYGGTIVTWESSNTSILDNNGKFTQPFNDTEIQITYTVTATEPSMFRTYVKTVVAEGLPMSEKIQPVIDWIEKNVINDGYISTETEFVTYVEEYEAHVSWETPYGDPLKVEEIVDNPITSTGAYVSMVITMNGEKRTHTAFYKVKSNAFENAWDSIEYFVNEIAKDSYNFTKWGYIPFIENKVSDIQVDILPYTYGKQRTGITKTSTEYVVIHDTANTAPSANAEMHRRYITNLNNNPDSSYISWHYTVDEEHSIQHLPLDEVAYHAGDGSHVFGDVYHNTSFGKTDCIGGGNRNGIGIESCVNAGSDYNQTMRNMAKLTAELLIQYNLGFDRIKQHWHFAGKDCPNVIRNTHRWELFIYLVQLEYYVKTQLPEATFNWKAMDGVMDEYGRFTQTAGTLKYGVEVTYKGETKIFNLQTEIRAN